MPVIAEVQFAHDDGALTHTIRTLPGLDVRVVRETSTAPRDGVYYLGFENESTAAIEAALERDSSVVRAELMARFDRYRVWATEFAEQTALMAPRVTSEGGLVVDAKSATNDDETRMWHERWLLPDRKAIQRIWQDARDEGFDFTLLEFHRGGQVETAHRGTHALTEEQQRTIAVAYEEGYFAEPRDTSLQELGEELDLSASAVGGRLKRGMRALIGGTLVVDRPEGVTEGGDHPQRNKGDTEMTL